MGKGEALGYCHLVKCGSFAHSPLAKLLFWQHLHNTALLAHTNEYGWGVKLRITLEAVLRQFEPLQLFLPKKLIFH